MNNKNIENESEITFDKLKKYAKNTAIFNSIEHLISWDQETYMPKEGINIRTDQIAILSSHIHNLETSFEYKKLLSKFIDLKKGDILDKSLSKEKQIMLREWRKDFNKKAKIPSEFAYKFSKLTAESINLWAKARKENDFTLFAPNLQKIIDMNIEKANILGYDNCSYDALLDLFEPEMTTEKLDPLFSNLKSKLQEILKKIESSKESKNEKHSPITFECSEEKQLALSKEIMKIMDIDTNRCRLDLSTHPFTSGASPFDIRMTTRVKKDNFWDNISTTMHEGGHSLYELNLNPDYFGTPLGESLSLGVHESQSRWWETLIGKSKEFASMFLPIIKKIVQNPSFEKISLHDFYKAINKVKPSLIRVEADEVTYCLHIIIRYEIEKALIDKQIKAIDIPVIWNEKMKKYLGITPENNRDGCLQDIHWSMGAFGYFPTYALGNLYAAQLFHAFTQKYPSYQKMLKNGDLAFMSTWLKENIHIHGKRYSPDELIKMVTNSSLNEKYFIDYLDRKYSDIYNF